MSPLDGLPRRRGRPPRQAPVVELWLEALASPDGELAVEPPLLDELVRALAPWSEVGKGSAGPVRATFRLTEIGGKLSQVSDEGDDAVSGAGDLAEGSWSLEFLLQSVEDPSLLVPADQVWAVGGGLGRWCRCWPRFSRLLPTL